MKPFLSALLLLVSLLSANSLAQKVTRTRHKHSSPTHAPVFLPVLLSDPAEIIRRSAANEQRDAVTGRTLNYSETTLEKKLDAKGAVKSSESHTKQVLVINGDRLERMIARNGTPLPPDEASKEEEKLRTATHKYATETAEQRAVRMKALEKSRDDDRTLLEDIQQAYNFSLLASEDWNGHRCYVVQADPKPGFQPRSKDGKYLTKFRGKIWVDQKQLQWAKVDLEMVDAISFGWFVARLEKGTHIEVEQAPVSAPVSPEVWLPTQAHMRMQAKVALVQDLNYDQTRTYRDYKVSTSGIELSHLGGARSTP